MRTRIETRVRFIEPRGPCVPLAALTPIVRPEQDETQGVRHGAHVEAGAQAELVAPLGPDQRLVEDREIADDAQRVERGVERRVGNLLAAVLVAYQVAVAERVVDQLVALVERRHHFVEPVRALAPDHDLQMQRERRAVAHGGARAFADVEVQRSVELVDAFSALDVRGADVEAALRPAVRCVAETGADERDQQLECCRPTSQTGAISRCATRASGSQTLTVLRVFLGKHNKSRPCRLSQPQSARRQSSRAPVHRSP